MHGNSVTGLPGASVTSRTAAGMLGASLVGGVHAGGHGATLYDADGMRAGVLTAEQETPARHVHPESKELFKKCDGKMNCIRNFPIFGPPIESYGYRLVFALDWVQFLTKGLGNGFLASSFYNVFIQRYFCDGIEYQRFYTVGRLGWSIKPFTAMHSDAFVLFGYKKRWVLTVSCVIGAIGSLMFGLLPAGHEWGQLAAIMAFFGGYGQANIDILLEGLYARKIRQHPAAGPQLVSSIWILMNLASIISSSTQGVLSDLHRPEINPWIAAAAMALCFPFLLFNWLDEQKNRVERMEDHEHALEQARAEREQQAQEPFTHDAEETALDKHGHQAFQPNEEHVPSEDADEELYIPAYCGGAIEFNKEVIVRNWRITVFCLVMTAVVVASAVINTLYDGYPLLAMCISGTVVLIVLNFWALPMVVAKASLFGFLQQALSISISSPATTFFLTGEECNPGGPHFTNTFLYTINGVIGSAAGLVGVVAFSYLFSKRTYRLTFLVTTTAGIIAGIFDLCMIMRWNLKIGIPDHYFYVFGDSIICEVIYFLNWMPMCILLAQLCPRGSESMVYALLAAFSNFGQSVSSELGTLLLKFVWPVRTVIPCDFSNLWKLIVLVSFAIPIATSYPLIFLLLPSARVCDELDHTGKVKATEEIHTPVEDVAALQDDIEEQVSRPSRR